MLLRWPIFELRRRVSDEKVARGFGTRKLYPRETFRRSLLTVADREGLFSMAHLNLGFEIRCRIEPVIGSRGNRFPNATFSFFRCRYLRDVDGITLLVCQ